MCSNVLYSGEPVLKLYLPWTVIPERQHAFTCRFLLILHIHRDASFLFSILYVINHHPRHLLCLCFVPLLGKGSIPSIQAASSVTLWSSCGFLFLIDFPINTSCPPAEAVFLFLLPTAQSHDQSCPWRELRIPVAVFACPGGSVCVLWCVREEGAR